VKKLGLFLVISILAMGLVLLGGGSALANYGPHGGYGTWTDSNTDGLMTANEVNPDSDACAGCHRAHTAVSSITWTDTGGGVKNALLLGAPSASLMAYCYTCHSDAGSGAATNVQAGVYDNTVARVGAGFATKIGYATNQSTNGAVLNGGGIEDMGGAGASMSSIHTVDGAAGIAWGESHAGSTTGPGASMNMDCASCHDPHGSSNYRILKDTVNGIKVGGYLDASVFDPTPDPWVIGNEVGYPTAGFGLHRNYADPLQNPTGVAYQPDYTSARYAAAVGLDSDKGMSGWCAACHTQYNTVSSSGQGAYNASDGYGITVRHRHPVNQPLSTFLGPRPLLIDLVNSLNTPYGDGVDVPLEHLVATESRGTGQRNAMTDYIGCLTCHRAHGSDAVMSGYANSISSIDPQPDSGGVTPTTQGVQPTMDSALLRADNRGVCERCHNK
jgi:predicted CXXCH cytochrome family protein